MRSFWLPVLLILFYCPTAEAQYEWAPVGAKWYINSAYHLDTISDWPNYDKHSHYETIEVGGDTVVNGYTGRMVGNYFTFQDGYQVYLLWNDSLRLIFDFSLEPGDTVYFELPNCDVDKDPVQYPFLVDHVDTLWVDGFPLRQFYTLGDNGWGFNYAYTYTEKIGGERMPVEDQPFCFYIPEYFPSWTRCYEDSDLLYKTPGFEYECDYSKSTSILNPLAGFIHISPNPASENIWLSWSDTGTLHPDLTVHLYRSYGQLFSVSKWQSEDHDLIIPLKACPPGLLVIQLEDDQGHLWRVEKVVVE